MYRAVHADRSGRVIVSDHAAAAFDGAATVPFADALPLPNDATVVPIEREAVTLDRAGRTHRAAAGRLAVAALVPPGHLRTQLPAYADAPGRPELAPRPYAAVAADDRGDLVVSAVVLDRDPTHDAAANAFYGRWECALPVAAPSNEDPVPSIAPRFDGEADPREPAVFHPTADEVAERAIAHIGAGGTIVSFGRACEGEPLLAARVVEEAIRRIRAATRAGTIHLETNGSSPAALRRLAAAGLDSVTIRLASA